MRAAEALIGCILLGGKPAFWAIANVVTAEDMPTQDLARCFAGCKRVAESDGALDVFLVAEELERIGYDLAPCLMGLHQSAVSPANVLRYAELTRADAVSKRVKDIAARATEHGSLETLQGELSKLQAGQKGAGRSAREIARTMWAALTDRYQAKDELAGLSTGFPKLDEMTGGLQPGRVYGIGARAKMGKTVLALNIATNVAKTHHVFAWSGEMAAEELLQRAIASLAGVHAIRLQRPKMIEEDQWPHLTGAMAAASDLKLHVTDRTDCTIEDVEAEARQRHSSGQLDMLLIDYLGLLRMPKSDRHDLAVAHVTRRCKVIAKELSIPVLLVFQLNRSSETGATVRPPRPSDARDSGAIEQDLDAMMLLHRPSYYDQNAPKGLRLDLALQRNGPTGLIKLGDELEFCRFVHSDEEWQDPKTNKDNGL